MAAFIFVSSYPFSERVREPIPLSGVPVAIFRAHSSPQSEMAECTFAGFMLVAGVSLLRAQGLAKGNRHHST